MTANHFDYTDVYGEEGFIVDCTTMETTHWFEQVVMGFKTEEDGSITMIDLGYEAEYYENILPTTPEEFAGRCDMPVISEDIPTLEEVPEVVIETPVTVDPVPEELAETGTAEVITGALLGIALVVAGVFTMMKGRRVA